MAEYIRDEYGFAYLLPGPFDGIPEWASEARRRGSHYLDRDTVRFFQARTHGIIAGALLLDSVRFPDAPRSYRISIIASGGSVHHVADPQTGATEWDSLRKARRAAERVAESVGVKPWEVKRTLRADEWNAITPERQLAERMRENA